MSHQTTLVPCSDQEKTEAITSLQEEAWKPIPRFNGRYEASDTGRIRLAPSLSSGRSVLVRKLMLNRDGYLVTSIKYKGRYRPFLAHRLVVEAFVGPISEDMEVNHKDGDKQNNRLGNLEVVTHRENVQHAARVELIPNGEKHYKSTLTAEQVGEIRAIHAAGGRYEGGPTFASTARRFGLTPSAVVRIVRRKTWQHIP